MRLEPAFPPNAIRPAWQITRVTPPDQEDVRRLFLEVFGKPMSRATWEHKYGRGNATAFAVRQNGQMLAHYGCVFRDIRYFAKEQRAAHVLDVMVSPAARMSLARRGPFHRMASAFFESCLGPGRSAETGFGFPSQRAMRLGERLGLYAEIDEMIEIRLTSRPGGGFFRYKAIPVPPEAPDTIQRTLNGLWEEMARSLSGAIVGKRDWGYLKNRYAGHPDHAYKIMLIVNRKNNRAAGVCVFSRKAGEARLVDLIAPIDRMPELVAYSRSIAAGWLAPRLSIWITKAFAECLGDKNACRRPLDIRVPTAVWPKCPPTEQQRKKWWLTAGDSDLC